MIRPPAQISWLVEAVGQDAALAFVEANAGRRISVPKKARGSRIARLYGDEIAHALVGFRGAEEYEVPLFREWRVLLHRATGMSVDDIACRVGLTRRGVKLILSNGMPAERAPRARGDERQRSLAF